ncbi:MAG: XdhC family protein [Anaerolineae bacterium]|nr:XdhC family protein [Anaerolineae bacterium]
MEDTRAVYAALLEAQNQGNPVALATIVSVVGSVPRHAGSKMLVYPDGRFVGTVGGGTMESRVIQEALAALADGEARVRSYTLNDPGAGDAGVCGGTLDIFIEPIGVVPTLLVIGGGHVGRALAQLGKWMDFRVILSDDRPEFCSAEYLPGLDGYVVCAPGEIAQHTRVDRQTYVAAVTRGLPIDINLVPALLATDAAYIGVIGSRRRWALTSKALREERGLTDEQLRRVRAPIGLELRAETPKEIALSILSEIVMLQRGGTGAPMQWLGDVEETEKKSAE